MGSVNKELHTFSFHLAETSPPRDNQQFALAMIIICSFALFEGMIILNGQVNFEDSFQVLSMTAPFVGTIIGFYFGQKPTQNLTTQVVKATSEKEDMKNKLVKTVDNSDSLETRLESLKKKLESLNSIISE